MGNIKPRDRQESNVSTLKASFSPHPRPLPAFIERVQIKIKQKSLYKTVIINNIDNRGD